ncbi:hypothetical protein AXF15_04060 [Desulfomicrobium orale DSM 12838]|uniref:Uncharacterized protein n=1 Tax=Desulfomicrobium orale DSM 12838 TaxID=888061 RepID=A0A0X8JP80_9BACT|nr:hypothetical protein AXF15_04060 [Desulfomicrobium orale DSM 12838]
MTGQWDLFRSRLSGELSGFFPRVLFFGERLHGDSHSHRSSLQCRFCSWHEIRLILSHFCLIFSGLPLCTCLKMAFLHGICCPVPPVLRACTLVDTSFPGKI